MKPYYEDEQVTLYHCDNREWFINYWGELDTFDLLLTDPPYNEVNRKSAGLRTLDRGGADDLEVDIEWYADVFDRITTGSIYVWCGMRQLSKWLDEFVKLELSVRGGVWHKTNALPLNADYIWVSALEAVAFARKDNAYFDSPVSPLLFTGPTRPMTDVHPVAKPLWLFEKIIETSCPPNGTVFDPFVGCGTTLEACKKMGRKGIGIEIDEAYCETAAKRLSQGVLF